MTPKTLKAIQNYWHHAQDLGSLPVDYETWPAARKQTFLWEERILKSKYDALPPLEKIDVVGLFLTALKKKMDRQADEAPANWEKAIHARGSVVKVRFIPAADTPFTGLFQGADYGLLRLSVTGDPRDRGFAPGLALKWFVDGHASENVSALVSLIGQGQNYNFFAHELSNIVPVVNQVGPKLINLIFRRVTQFPTKLYLEGLGSIDQSGQPVADPDYPVQIFLVPANSIQFSESPHEFRKDFDTIPAETTLFAMYGGTAESAGDAARSSQYRQQAQLIGHIQTTSEFVNSFYGDSQLFFRHQRFRNR
ncbi:MAG: hypothetical protein F6J97_26425 [Leptolyngbya sp. SIO4C1]|nr:hypothetical protein [Leptolyngbya sp. SIO4C1]